MTIITFNNRSLTPTQLQQVLEYINTHLDRDLSLVEIARAINISPTYFASLTLLAKLTKERYSRIFFANKLD